MSVLDNNGPTGRPGVKTLAIRLEPDLHAQLSLIAQLRSATITDEIKAALDAHIGAVKHTPELAARAGSVLEDIEREALARRTAIATLFGDEQPAPVTAADVSTAAVAPDAAAVPAAAEPSARRGRREGSSSGGSAVKDS